MAIINFKEVTKAIQKQLKDNLKGDYVVHRNIEVEKSPDVVAHHDAWICVYRKKVTYEPQTIGRQPWLARPEAQILVQVADASSGDAAEDKLQDAEKAVIDAIELDRTLGGEVSMIVGYSSEYDYDRQRNIYFHRVLITIEMEARA